MEEVTQKVEEPSPLWKEKTNSSAWSRKHFFEEFSLFSLWRGRIHFKIEAIVESIYFTDNDVSTYKFVFKIRRASNCDKLKFCISTLSISIALRNTLKSHEQIELRHLGSTIFD